MRKKNSIGTFLVDVRHREAPKLKSSRAQAYLLWHMYWEDCDSPSELILPRKLLLAKGNYNAENLFRKISAWLDFFFGSGHDCEDFELWLLTNIFNHFCKSIYDKCYMRIFKWSEDGEYTWQIEQINGELAPFFLPINTKIQKKLYICNSTVKSVE